MTDPSEAAMRLAIELEVKGCIGVITTRSLAFELDKIAAALRAPPAQGEPVAWRFKLRSGAYQLTSVPGVADMWRDNDAGVEPLYAAPFSPDIDRVRSLWEDVRIRGNVRKDYWELAEAIDKLVGVRGYE